VTKIEANKIIMNLIVKPDILVKKNY